MEHAWLDSLSEDWVSQHGSDHSDVALPAEPIELPSSSPKISPNRIRQRSNGARSPIPPTTDNTVLSERSANDINMSVHRQRVPSKLSQEIMNEHDESRSRQISGSTEGSVVHNTVQHQSPGKRDGDTPEWKRRLLMGDIAYGEQRDLFCSAANGLQDMFKPPKPDTLAGVEEEDNESLAESSMPSSPPVYARRRASTELEREVDNLEDDEELEFPNEVTPSPSPRRIQRELQYRLNVEDSSVMDTPSNRLGASRPNDVEIYRDESCLSAISAVADQTRKTSGQSDTRNEDFSPIIIEKHSAEDGKVDFSPLELPADQLKQKLERLRQNQMLWNSKSDFVDEQEDDNEESGAGNTTADFARQGGYVNTQRGGRSGEGSFYHRALSPGFNVDTSEMLPEDSLQASTPKQFPTVRTEATAPYNKADHLSPSLPRAPFPSPEKRHIQTGSQRGPSATSPLKLFGPYDTFTNQTLLRRISQFEEGMSGTSSRQSLTSDGNQQDPPAISSRNGSRSVSEFGAGHFEGYEFNGDLSYSADDDSSGISDFDKENMSPRVPSLRHPQMDFAQHQSSPDEEDGIFVRRRRDKSQSSSTSKNARNSSGSHLRKSLGFPEGTLDEQETPKRDSGSEVKRPRTSPSKDPTPKRRRTLHRSDIAFGRENLAGIDLASQQVQAVTGRKIQDRVVSGFDLAGPQVLASRSILRPRTPSGKLQHARRQQNSPLRDRSSHALLPGESPVDGERKPSIRTQDFVDQAAQIMAMIRSQVRPPGLASVEESFIDTEKPSPGLSDMGSVSTKEPFSRPPSREGKTSMARPPQQQEDPGLVERLKKYQEASDMGDIISSSIRSMGLAQEATRAAQEVERQINEHQRSRQDIPFSADEADMVSDIPHVRITTNPTFDDSMSPPHDFPSNGSGQLTNRSYPTGSSRGSDSRKIIMPESVSHLIPERVGSMRLDKDNRIWVKSRDGGSVVGSNILPSDSEDDPFASISDLSVDLTKEMQNLRLTTARKENVHVQPEHLSAPISPLASDKGQNTKGFVTLSPDGRLSSGEASPVAKEEVQKLHEKHSPRSSEEGTSESSAVGDHLDADPLEKVKRRNITITFSSPVASYIQDVQADDLYDLSDGDSETGPSWTQVHSGVGTPALKSGGARRGHVRTPSRQAQNGQFIPRPVSRIDEQDEDSTVELPHHDNNQLSIIGETSVIGHKISDGQHTSLSFVLNRTPGHGALSLRDDSVLIGQNVGKLSLSPLSEFTINQSDASFGFEVSYVKGNRHMETGDGSRRVMSMTIRDLVDRLSEVEPREPYWEDLTELDLQDKRLTSLHMLDEFCGKIVTLDASKNALGHLDGVPSTVRQLKVAQNMLTELTSWDHLYNLQYVDISGNELTSLSALKHLVHLRTIKADDNHLTSLDGLDCHDGLLSLRARGNCIQEIDFDVFQFERLTDLDVARNEIRSVRNVENLPSLTKLNVSGNDLESFVVHKPATTLRQLDLSDNKLVSLDISHLPSLQSLYADRNHLTELCGFERAHKLDSLSLREQRGDEPMDLKFLAHAYEVRKLFLSGNLLGAFDPQVDFLNLQLLELANCGLQSLPKNLGQLMPNLRTLNLNFNGIADLSPLRFIPRLKKLLAAGNRLTDSTAVTELLTDFPHLTQLDLRDNPITLGFYAPLQMLVSMKDAGVIDPFVLPEADAEKDSTFAKRLDEATKQRRRLHQIVFAASCSKLRMLDGLRIRRRDVLARDELFVTLLTEGLLPLVEEEPRIIEQDKLDADIAATNIEENLPTQSSKIAEVCVTECEE